VQNWFGEDMGVNIKFVHKIMCLKLLECVLEPELKSVMWKYWCSDWRYVSPARRFCCSRLVL